MVDLLAKWKKEEEKRKKSYAKLKLSSSQGGLDGDRDMSSQFKCLEGATIVGTGFLSEVPEGGFAIDYKAKDTNELRRMILGYTELGLWVEWEGKLSRKK